MKHLSIIIPAFNEEKTIYKILDRIKDVHLINDIKKEIIIINDCSKDNTKWAIEEYMEKNKDLNIFLFNHQVNKGKWAAIHTWIDKATGDYIIIQDADLEYDPKEYNILLQPIEDWFADIVYGSRFTWGNPHRILFFFHSIWNKFLTFLSNLFSNLNLTDMETCYKLFKSDIVKSIELQEKRFWFEPEITQKIARIKNIRIYEVGISYYGRTFEEWKKISWKDGVRAIYCIVKYGLFHSK
ncbi:MAG: Glycosyltransferase [uncultured bacterium (gcode 4)]|uniref:Glycosyltransferase n=1 Tax=uncultured bacterium (gcode 4) TaxID=1234023 RepID=K1XYC3_9BACT|nr:MAG: Glycosyltransferase [uncultured bacterium (gcode 4)]